MQPRYHLCNQLFLHFNSAASAIGHSLQVGVSSPRLSPHHSNAFLGVTISRVALANYPAGGIKAEFRVGLILCQDILEVPLYLCSRRTAISEVPHRGSTLSSCHRMQPMIHVQSSRRHHIHTSFPRPHWGSLSDSVRGCSPGGL